MRLLRLLAMSLLLAATLVLPGAGAAAAASGVCKTSSGVTVVVSFGSLGGGTVVRCVTAGGSGLDALHSAGLSTEGTIKDGPGFVCRIQGKPTVGSGESCRSTPSTNRSWRYFHASNGGSWVHSQSGAGNRNTVDGEFEGWSYGGGSTPTVAPRRSSDSGGSSKGSTGSDGGSDKSGGSGKSGGSTQDGGTGSANGPSSAGDKALPKPKPRSGDSNEATGKSPRTTDESATPSTKPGSADAKNAAATSSDGKGWVPWVAAIVIIALIATAIVTQRRRSS